MSSSQRFVSVVANMFLMLFVTTAVTKAVPAREATPTGTTTAVTSYAQSQTLSDALGLVRHQLMRDGKEQFLPLVTEPAIRQAIRSALASYQADLSSLTPPAASEEEQKVVFENFQTVAAIYRQIAETGNWPEGATFAHFYELGTDRGISSQGLGLRLEVNKPGKEGEGFALPVIDMWYGKTE